MECVEKVYIFIANPSLIKEKNFELFLLLEIFKNYKKIVAHDCYIIILQLDYF